MLRRNFRRKSATRLANGLLTALVLAGSILAQERVGSITGKVTDPAGASVPGATVEVSGPSLPQAVSAKTDSGGNYLFPSLPPGTYTVTVSHTGFATLKRPQLELQVGRTFRIDARLEVGSVTESVVVSGDAVIVDTATTTVATNISSNVYDRLPKGRSFDSLITLAPGVRSEPKSGGFQIDGSSGSEHSWVVDGIDVSNIRTGELSSQARFPVEWIAETQVKSSGFDAQFGGAIGGVIASTTRSGGNDFHGQVSVYLGNDGMDARGRPVVRLNPNNDAIGEYFHDPEDDRTFVNPVLQLGGPIKRNMLWFLASVSPQFTRRERNVTFLSNRQTSHFRRDDRQDYTLAKVDFQPVSRLRASMGYMYNPLRVNGLLPTYQGTDAFANPWADRGYRSPATGYSFSGDYTFSSKLVLNVFGGHEYANNKDYGIPRGTRYRYANGNTSLPFTSELPANVRGAAGNLTPDNRQNVQEIFTRDTLHVTGSYLLGSHNLKFGWDINGLANRPSSGTWPDGYVFVYWDRDYPAQTKAGRFRGKYGYYIRRAFALEADVKSSNQGLFLNDNWRVSKKLTLNLGLRSEREYLPSFDPRFPRPIEFGFGSKIAPRLGFAYDPKGDGRMKFAASWGFYYDMMKYEMPRGSFGGEKWLDYMYTLDDPNIFNIKPVGNGFAGCTCPGTLIETLNLRSAAQDPADNLIEPDLKPVRLQAWNLSYDYNFTNNYVFGMRYVHRQLDRAIEDIGVLKPGVGETYFIANPGFGVTVDPKNFPAGFPASVTPKAVRDYDAIEFRIEKRFSSKFAFQTSYSWSRLYGNYSGLANSDENGRTSPNVNRVFDLPWMAYNEKAQLVYGRLATDRPHAFKFYGSYDLKSKLGLTRFSPIFELASGTPLSSEATVLHVPVQIFGRGDLGRTSAWTNTDLMVLHDFKVAGEGRSLRVELNVVNLFNHGKETGRSLAIDHANDGGLNFDTEAAIFKGYNTRSMMAAQEIRNSPYFNWANSFTGPRTLRLGFHFIF